MLKEKRRTMNLIIDIMKRILLSIFKLGGIFDKKCFIYEKILYFWEKNIGAGPLYAALFLKFTKAKNLGRWYLLARLWGKQMRVQPYQTSGMERFAILLTVKRFNYFCEILHFRWWQGSEYAPDKVCMFCKLDLGIENVLLWWGSVLGHLKS